MIEINCVEVGGIETALRGMRNPLASWKKSDSYYNFKEGKFIPGEEDLELAKKLITSGDDHGKLARQIYIGADITAPLYWWKEMDQYKVGTTTNSESTMHTLTKRPITINDFSVNDADYDLNLSYEGESITVGDAWEAIISTCEALRLNYIATKDKRYWDTLVRLLPNGWLQMRTWTGNYAVLKNIYYARRNHKLKEWHDFCDFIEQLPYAEYLILTGEK